MARESIENKKKRTAEIFAVLRKLYPKAHCSLNHKNPWQLLVATILSAQCTDERVNIVTADLFKKYRTAKAFANAPLAELEQAVRSTGFYRNKAKNIKNSAAMIVENFKGKVPQTMDELLTLPGVARKTANVVLGNAFGVNVGFVVDTHVKRLTTKMGLTKNTDPNKIERDLMAITPSEEWMGDSHLLIYHGRALCIARRPKCPDCPLAEKKLCPGREV